jgi:hypothetical protein
MLDTHRMPKPLPPRLLQAYLQELSHAAAETDIITRKRELLRSYAELQYRISGGGRCSLCNAHVRHALPVSVQSEDGMLTRFECLCTRCFEGERVRAQRVSIHAGEVIQHYDSKGKVTYESVEEQGSKKDVPS